MSSARPATSAGRSGASSSSGAPADSLKEAANAKYKAGDYEGAVEAYSAALAANETSVLYTNRAAAKFMLKRFQDAVEDCTKAISLDKDNVKAYIRAGKAYLALGSFSDALSILARGMAVDPRDESVKLERAATAAVQRKFDLAKGCLAAKPPQFDRALSYLDSIVEQCPASYDVHMLRLEAMMGLKKYDEAYTVTTELMSGRKAVADTGASAAMEEGDKKAKAAAGGSGAASKTISASLASRGAADTRLLLRRAQILNLQGNSAGAIRHLQEALRVDPDDTSSAKMLRFLRKQESLKAAGNDLFKAGKWKEACDSYTECLNISSSSSSSSSSGPASASSGPSFDGTDNPQFLSKLYCNRAAAYMKMGKNEDAMEDCGRCIDLDPNYSKAYIRRAQAGMAVGGLEAVETAVRDYNKAKELLIAEAKASGSSAGPDKEILRELEKGLKDAKGALKKAKRKDYYKILDVSKDVDEDGLRKAYRKMALKYHPDKNACADEKDKAKAEATFKDVGEAYAILNDPTKRRQYDMGATFNASGDIDVTADDDDDGPHGGMGGMRGFGGGGGVRMAGGMGGGIPMDLFEMLFAAGAGGGGGMGGMGGGPRRR